jgi:hypothetical protein
MERTYIKDLGAKVGGEVSISGWVDVVRDWPTAFAIVGFAASMAAIAILGRR